MLTYVDIVNNSVVVDPDPHGSGPFAWIRIQIRLRNYSSGSGIIVPDPGIRIQIRQKVKEHINKTVNSGLFVLLDSSIE